MAENVLGNLPSVVHTPLHTQHGEAVGQTLTFPRPPHSWRRVVADARNTGNTNGKPIHRSGPGTDQQDGLGRGGLAHFN